MECGGSVRAARIPIEFDANSTSCSFHDRRLGQHEPRQTQSSHRHQHQRQQQQQQQSRDNDASSSVNGRPISSPPPRGTTAAAGLGSSPETIVREWNSSPRPRPEAARPRPEWDRDRPARQRSRPLATRPPRAESDSRRGEHSSSRGQTTPGDRGTGVGGRGAGEGAIRGYSSGDESGDDGAGSTSTRSPVGTAATDNQPSDISWQKRRTDGP